MDALAASAVADLFRRIPALGDLRGAARIDAEEAVGNAIADAIEDYLAECEMVAFTGGAP